MIGRLFFLWVLAATPIAIGHVQEVTADSTTHWVWQNPLPNGNRLFSIACGGLHHCVAVGMNGRVMVTRDDGRTWTRHDLGTHVFLNDLSCPTVRVCLAMSSPPLPLNVTPEPSVVRTDNGGLTWRTVHEAPMSRIYGFSCPGALVCFLTGSRSDPAPGDIWRTGDGGRTWSVMWQGQGGRRWPYGIACRTVAVCFGFGYSGLIMVTRDGGKHWRTLSPHVGQYTVSGVSCPSDTTCFASAVVVPDEGEYVRVLATATQSAPATTVRRSTDGGKHWTDVLDVDEELGAVVCASVRACYVPGSRLLVTGDSGRSWRRRTPPHRPIALACPAVTVCEAIAGIRIDSTRDMGAHWTSTPERVAFEQGLDSIACPLVTTCYAAGHGGIVATMDGGKAWASVLRVDETLTDISCGTASDCVAVGYQSEAQIGIVETTHDAGRTWQWMEMPNAPDTPAHISCPSSTRCSVVRSTAGSSSSVPTPQTVFLETSVDGGRSWTESGALAAALRSVAPPPVGASPNLAARDIACPSALVCYVPSAVNQTSAVAVTHDGGATWEVAPGPQGVGWAIACPAIQRCFIAQAGAPLAIAMTLDGGSSWLSYPDTAVPPLADIACGSATSCVAVSAFFNGGGIFGTEDGGKTWFKQDSPSSLPLVAVACPGANICYAVSDDVILKSGP